MLRFYTGIGSRKTPFEIRRVMTAFARVMFERNIWLRTGGAEGADQAFMAGADYRKWIYLPWHGFNGLSHLQGAIVTGDHGAARDIARRYHPAWHKLSRGGRALMTRNVHQVLGYELDQPSILVVAWTPDGQDSGGTGLALRLAADHKIPILNLQRPDDLQKVLRQIKQHRQRKAA